MADSRTPRKGAAARMFGHLLLSTVILAGGTVAPFHAALAQQTSGAVAFSVPAGPLGQALIIWGRQAGVQISYLDAATQGKSTQGIAGTLSPEQALARLLAGSGLDYAFTARGSVTISAVPQTQAIGGVEGAVQLSDILLQGGLLGSHDDTFTTAGSVAYVSGEEIAQNRGTSVGDFLSGIPGVVNGDTRNSGALDLNIRGLQGQGRVKVVIDGASQEQTVYRGYNGARSGSYLDPDFIGEVAVEKGASAGADALGAIGGTVRMQTLSVNDILLPGRKFGIRIRGGMNTNSTSPPEVLTKGGVIGGMFQTGQPTVVRDGGNMNRPGALKPTGGNGSIAMAFTTDRADFVAAIAKRRNGNYFAGEHGAGQAQLVDLGDNGYGWTVIGYEGLSPWKGGEEILNTSTENTSTLLKGNFRIGSDQTLELGYQRFQSRFGEIMPTRLGSHTSAVGGFQSELDNLDLKSYTARYRWNPTSDLIDLKVDAFRTDLDHRATNIFTLTAGWPPQQYLTTPLGYSQVIRSGVTVSNQSLIEGVPGELKLTYGGSWQRETVGMPKKLDDFDWVVNNLEFPPRTGSRVESSGFLSADWQINPAWQVTGGLRYSDFKTTDRNYRFNISGIWPNATHELVEGKTTYVSGHGWSKNLGVSWTPKDDLQFYARYSDSMRMPSLFETLNGFSTAYLPADLRAERARTLELGVNKHFRDLLRDGDSLRLHLAYYDNSIDDYLTRSNVKYPPPGIAFQEGGLGMINLENARMRGLELATDYQSGDFSARFSWSHALTSRFCARPGTLHRQPNDCEAGGFVNSYALQHVPPKNSLTLQLGYRMLDDKLSLGTRITHHSNRFVQTTVASTSEIQPGRWKPYTLVDVYASYKITEASQIDLAIDNLTDRYYMDALNAARMPAPGRTLRVNFTTKF